MAAPTHKRHGDTIPVLYRTFTQLGEDGSEAPILLPSGTTVEVHLRREDESAVTTYAAEIVNPAQASSSDPDVGAVRYVWPNGQQPLSANPSEPVQYRFRFVASLPSAQQISMPTRGEDVLVVHPEGP